MVRKANSRLGIESRGQRQLNNLNDCGCIGVPGRDNPDYVSRQSASGKATAGTIIAWVMLGIVGLALLGLIIYLAQRPL